MAVAFIESELLEFSDNQEIKNRGVLGVYNIDRNSILISEVKGKVLDL